MRVTQRDSTRIGQTNATHNRRHAGEQTQVEVNKINLDTNKLLRTAYAEASLIKSKAIAQAKLIKAQAQTNGEHAAVSWSVSNRHLMDYLPLQARLCSWRLRGSRAKITKQSFLTSRH